MAAPTVEMWLIGTVQYNRWMASGAAPQQVPAAPPPFEAAAAAVQARLQKLSADAAAALQNPPVGLPVGPVGLALNTGPLAFVFFAIALSFGISERARQFASSTPARCAKILADLAAFTSEMNASGDWQATLDRFCPAATTVSETVWTSPPMSCKAYRAQLAAQRPQGGSYTPTVAAFVAPANAMKVGPNSYRVDTTVNVNLSAAIVVPDNRTVPWSQAPSAAEVAEWERLVDALIVHEAGHIDIGLRFAIERSNQPLFGTGSSPDEAGKSLNARVVALVATDWAPDLDGRGIAYNKLTDDGINQAAAGGENTLLDCS